MEENQISSWNERESRQMNHVETNSSSPEILTNNIYTPAFLRQHLGKLVRVEFLIGTNNLVDRVGILEDVGASYILLRSVESSTLVYADIYAIKFVTIANNPFSQMNNMNSMNNMSNMYYNQYSNPIF